MPYKGTDAVTGVIQSRAYLNIVVRLQMTDKTKIILNSVITKR